MNYEAAASAEHLPLMLTIGEAAALLRVSKTTMRAMIANGTVAVWKPSQHVRTQRIPRAVILAMVENAMTKESA